MVGLASALKKSVLRRWASRSGSLVFTEVKSTLAVSRVSARDSPTTRVPSKRSKRPRTLVRPRWRMTNPTPEWAGSRFQVPAVRGRLVVLASVIVTDPKVTSVTIATGIVQECYDGAVSTSDAPSPTEVTAVTDVADGADGAD